MGALASDNMGPGVRTLSTVVFVGSARDVVPPWGGDSRLGDRVLKHVLAALSERKSTFGEEEVLFRFRPRA